MTDPARHVLLVNVRFRSLTGKRLALYALYDPSLGNDGDGRQWRNERQGTAGKRCGQPGVERADRLAAFSRTSNGYVGTPSDGWEDLRSDYRMNGNYGSAPTGNVVQTARTKLTGVRQAHAPDARARFRPRHGAGSDRARASSISGVRLDTRRVRERLAPLLAGLKGVPTSASAQRTLYNVSVMTLAAHEDKTYRGGYVASPTMPWIWGDPTKIENPSGPITSSGRATCTRSPPR